MRSAQNIAVSQKCSSSPVISGEYVSTLTFDLSSYGVSKINAFFPYSIINSWGGTSKFYFLQNDNTYLAVEGLNPSITTAVVSGSTITVTLRTPYGDGKPTCYLYVVAQ